MLTVKEFLAVLIIILHFQLALNFLESVATNYSQDEHSQAIHLVWNIIWASLDLINKYIWWLIEIPLPMRILLKTLSMSCPRTIECDSLYIFVSFSLSSRRLFKFAELRAWFASSDLFSSDNFFKRIIVIIYLKTITYRFYFNFICMLFNTTFRYVRRTTEGSFF
jgi:hypothetical protein